MWWSFFWKYMWMELSNNWKVLAAVAAIFYAAPFFALRAGYMTRNKYSRGRILLGCLAMAVAAGISMQSLAALLVFGILAVIGFYIPVDGAKFIYLAPLVPSLGAACLMLCFIADDAKTHAATDMHFARQDARLADETAAFLKRDHFLSFSWDESIEFVNAGVVTIIDAQYHLIIPKGYSIGYKDFHSYDGHLWALRMGNPDTGDFLVAIFSKSGRCFQPGWLTTTRLAELYEDSLWSRKGVSRYDKDRIFDREVVEWLPAVAIVSEKPPKAENMKKGEESAYIVDRAVMATQRREFYVEVYYDPAWVDFGHSLPITWLTRFALANAEPSLSLPEKPGLKLDAKEVRNLPDWEDHRNAWIRREGWEYQ